MNNITTTLTTEAVFSDDNCKRYLLKKTWNTDLPKMTIIMLAPSEAAGIELDTTTQLVLNNASRLGYGSVVIVNLFATLNDFSLKRGEEEDAENMQVITEAVKTADMIVYAPGTGRIKSKVFQERVKQVVGILRPYEGKLKCLCNEVGKARLQHPLSPSVRSWTIAELRLDELLPKMDLVEPKLPKKKGRPTVTKKEVSA